MLKYCRYCYQEKFFDPTKPAYSEASGFYGNRCNDCRIITREAWLTGRKPPVTKHALSNKERIGNRREAVLAVELKTRMPMWANRAQIQKFYQKAVELKLVVDHVIPLVHPKVCGLHVQNNLQLLTRSANLCKRNKFDEEWS